MIIDLLTFWKVSVRERRFPSRGVDLQHLTCSLFPGQSAGGFFSQRCLPLSPSLVVTRPPRVPRSCSSVSCVTLPCCSQFSPDPCPAVLLSSAGLNLGTEQSTHQRFLTHLVPWPAPCLSGVSWTLPPSGSPGPPPLMSSISHLDTLMATPSWINWFSLASKRASLCNANSLYLAAQ